MTEIADLERRITAALDRIGTGLGGIDGGASSSELDEMRDALSAEKVASAQLEERVKTLHDGHDTRVKELETQLDGLKSSAHEATSEVQKLRRTNQDLQTSLQALREASTTGVEPHLINQVMMTELEGLRSVRDTDRAELDEILGALSPMLGEARDA